MCECVSPDRCRGISLESFNQAPGLVQPGLTQFEKREHIGRKLLPGETSSRRRFGASCHEIQDECPLEVEQAIRHEAPDTRFGFDRRRRSERNKLQDILLASPSGPPRITRRCLQDGLELTIDATMTVQPRPD